MAEESDPTMAPNQANDKILGIALEAFRVRHPSLLLSGRINAGPAAFIQRIDLLGTYILVPITEDAHLRGIVQLNAQSLTVESIAVIRDPDSVFLVNEKAALAAAKIAHPDKRGWRKPFLGWRPCRESFNSMRPLWVVPHSKGRVHVTQDCEVFEVLTKGHGG